jgi:hypothetical protein
MVMGSDRAQKKKKKRMTVLAKASSKFLLCLAFLYGTEAAIILWGF